MALLTLLLAIPASAKEMPGATELLDQQVRELDGQIAKRMLRRPDTPSEKMPRLDMEIDLRIAARWFFAQAAAQKEANDVQVVGRLRGLLALEAVVGVESILNNQREKLTLGQVEGMSRLHELTFKLADAKGAASLDDVSRQLATAALMIAGPGAPDPKALPPMRPRLPPSDRPAAQRDEVTNVPLIADRVPALNVSTPLRQQLTLLVAATLADKEKEHGAVARTLGTAFELAAALDSNLAVAPDARVQMEAQLAEGIALFLDARTRAAGRVRISDLNEYRKIVERIGRLRLSPDDAAKYAPVFAWAQREPEGVRALGALERYVRGRERAARRAASVPNALPNLRHPVQDLEKQYAAAQQAFDAAYNELIKSTGGTGAAALEARASEMTQTLDALERLDQTPVTLDALGALKPKPFGGLERRIVTAAVAIASRTSTEKERADALGLLNDLHQLAQWTAELNALPAADFTGPVDSKYAGGRVAIFEARWKSIAAEVASSVAAGGDVDPAKVARVRAARTIYDALREAGTIEASIATSSLLHRWLDWRMRGEDLEVVFQPYQEALSAAVGAYLADAPKPLEEWSRIEKRYRPLVHVVTRARAFHNQVHALPDGLWGTVASLLTPCENAPYGAERHLSFAVAVCRARLTAGDEPSASEALELLLKRVNND